MRLELGLHGGQRQRVLEIVLVVVEFLGLGLLFLAVGAGLGRLGLAGRGLTVGGGLAVAGLAGQRLARRRLGVGALIGGFEIDDVAQQNLAFVQLVAPDDDGLEGERALAQAGDHGLAAGLDALGDGDLALARQQLDRAHLAQIHADRIVGAIGGLLGGGLGFGHRGGGHHGARGLGGALLALRRFLGLVGVDHVDAHVGQHRHGVLDLLGGHFLGGQHLVQLVIGHKAALLRGLEQLLDCSVGHVEHGAIMRLGRRLLLILGFSGFGCHAMLLRSERCSFSETRSPSRPRSACYSKRSAHAHIRTSD